MPPRKQHVTPADFLAVPRAELDLTSSVARPANGSATVHVDGGGPLAGGSLFEGGSADPRVAHLSGCRWVLLSALHSSRDQTRLSIGADLDAIKALASEIRSGTLLAAPHARPHSTIPGEFELVVGHRRVQALTQLASEEVDHPVLQRSTVSGEVRIPVHIVELGDDEAHRRTLAENSARSDLRPFESIVAIARFMERLRVAGKASADGSVPLESLARHLGVKRTTLEPLWTSARDLTPAVFYEAGLLAAPDGDLRSAMEPQRLLHMSAAAFERAAKQGTLELRARRLALEVASLDESGRRIRPQRISASETGCGEADQDGHAEGPSLGIQVNIRKPLDQIGPQKAADHAVRLAPALATLLGRGAAHLTAPDRLAIEASLRAGLDAVAKTAAV